MSLLDYFLRRRKARPERQERTSPIATAAAITVAPPADLAARAARARTSIQELMAGATAMGNVATFFQKESYAWSATARHLARIVADVIMPDATEDERDDYAQEIAYAIMKTEAAHYEDVIR